MLNQLKLKIHSAFKKNCLSCDVCSLEDLFFSRIPYFRKIGNTFLVHLLNFLSVKLQKKISEYNTFPSYRLSTGNLYFFYENNLYLAQPYLSSFFLNRQGDNEEVKWKIPCYKVILNVIGTTNQALLFLFFERFKPKIFNLWCSFSFLARKTLNNLLERREYNHFPDT